MKAIILAAGEGTRLRPLTYEKPKIMLPIAGRPMLEYMIASLRHHGIREIAINLSHLPQAVMDWLGDGSRLDVHVVYSLEKKPLGTAGALTRLKSFFDETFVVFYGDMLTDLDYGALERYHRSKGGLATVTLFEVDDPRAYGIVEIGDEKRILRFVEKPAPGTTTSNLANAGIYVVEPRIIDYIPDETFYDFGFNVFPDVLAKGEKMYGYITDATILDAGTMANYQETDRVVSEGRFKPVGISS